MSSFSAKGELEWSVPYTHCSLHGEKWERGNSSSLIWNNDERPSDFSNSLASVIKEKLTKAIALAILAGTTSPFFPVWAKTNTNTEIRVTAPYWDTATSSRKALSREEQRNILSSKLLSLSEASWVDEAEKEFLQETIMDVATFLQVMPNGISFPDLSYSDDGEIFLSWVIDGDTGAELSFSKEFGHAYAILKEGVYYPGSDNLTPSQFPEDLLNHLKIKDAV